jgi:RHS repeat-associated protein
VEVKRGPDAQSAQTVASYAYDGNGNRVTKAEPTAEGLKVTTFLVDESQQYAQVVEEREEVAEQPAQVTVAYVYGDDLLNQLRGGQRTYYHYDGLGSTRALSDGGGHITDTYRYEAFGNLAAQTGSTPNLYRFTGEQFDPDLEMYYLRARYLDVNMGRLSTLDVWPGTLFMPVSLNGYSYAYADPVNGHDPSGHTTLGELTGGINSAVTLTNNAVSLFNFIRGDPNAVKVDSIPTIWDYVMAMLVRGVAGSVAAALPAAPSAPNSKRLENHHTIPVYVCGHEEQRKSKLAKPDHDKLHFNLYRYKLGIDLAGVAIDLLVYRKPTSRIIRTPLQRLGAKAVGRAAIASGLAFFYARDDWLTKGKPSIGLNLALETPRFVGRHHSAPVCQRP